MKMAPRVVVYTHKDAAQLAARLNGERIHRLEALELVALDLNWLAQLEAKLERRMTFSLTIAEGHVYLTIGEATLPCVLRRVPLGVRG